MLLSKDTGVKGAWTQCKNFQKTLFGIVIKFALQKYIIGIYDFPQKNALSNVISEISSFKILFTKFSKILLHHQ